MEEELSRICISVSCVFFREWVEILNKVLTASEADLKDFAAGSLDIKNAVVKLTVLC